MVNRLKLALEEMWILACLNCRDMSALEMLDILREKRGDALEIVYPTMPLYELTHGHYIKEVLSNTKRKYLTITNKGIEYLSELRQKYGLFVQKNNIILQSVET